MSNSSISLTILLCLLMAISSRRHILLPFIMSACLIPMNQRIIIFDLDFTVLRLLLVVALIKLLWSRNTKSFQWNKFDNLFFSWRIIGSLIYVIQQQNFSAVIYQSGVIFDSLGMYWIFRKVIDKWEDVSNGIKLFAIFALVSAPIIALEHFQETSLLSYFGPTLGQFHRGRFRAAGPFPHYIMMGCFWASLLPFFYSQIKIEKKIIFYWFVIIASLSNVYFSASSTPMMSVGAIIIAWKIYTYRKHGAIIFWAVCCCLLILHIIMKAPVWHLLSRVDLFQGSTGWHRYYLFDNFVRRWSEWVVLGTNSTAHWGANLSDLTNQFVLEGVRGGILSLALFIILMYNSVRIPGKYSLSCRSLKPQIISWGICVVMLGHIVTFWGVSYFGQIEMLLTYSFALVGFVQEQSIQQNNPSVPSKSILA